MFRKKPLSGSSLHFAIATTALFGIVAISGQNALRSSHANVRGSGFAKGPIAELGVEHTESLGLTMELSALHGKGIAEISHDGKETVFVSVPQDWTKREVRNVPISSVTSDPPSLGFARWHIPSGARISFTVPSAPSKIILHHPSDTPLKVDITRVNLDADTVDRDVILVQGASVEL